MQTVQGNMLESLVRVRSFLDTHAERLASVVQTGTRSRLDETIAALTASIQDQGSSNIAARKSTRVQYARRIALLKDHMAVVARIARASLPNTPELAALRMPKGSPSLARFAAAAHEMANGAAPHADVFVSAGLPADFAANLKAAADAMLAARGERGNNTGRRAGATEALKSGLSAGRKVVRVLDAMVKTTLKTQPGLLADWTSVSRVRRVATVAAAPADGATALLAPPASEALPATVPPSVTIK